MTVPAAAAASLRTAVAGAGLAELAWRAPDGAPRASVVVPLWHDDAVWCAATYAERDTVAEVVAARDVALAVTHLATAAPATPTLLLRARVSAVPDPDGGLFVAALLPQELRKHPPSRTLADSALLRRENWWFVPRLLLRLDPAEAPGAAAVEGLDAVRDPRTHAVLVTTPGGSTRADRPEVRVVARPAPGGEPVRAAGAADGPALLLAHQASPDLERRAEHRVRGGLRDGALVPGPGEPDPHTVPPLPGPLSLAARWRRQRAMQRACVAGLRAAGLH